MTSGGLVTPPGPAGEFCYNAFMDKREELAIQRTTLANQRTLLSFITASLTMSIAGISLIKFFSSESKHLFGGALIGLSLLTLALGIRNYFHHKNRIRSLAMKAPNG